MSYAMADDDRKPPQFPYGHSEFGTLSTDATPVTFNVGGITYRMPANYIQGYALHPSTEVQSIVVMPVVYPGVRPYSEETKHCFAAERSDRMPDCYLLDVFIEPPQPATSDPDVLERKQGNFGTEQPRQGPYGYSVLGLSGGQASGLYWKKLSHDLTISISCYGSTPIHPDVAVCDTSVHNKAGGLIKLRIDPANLYRADVMLLDVQKFVDDHIVGEQ